MALTNLSASSKFVFEDTVMRCYIPEALAHGCTTGDQKLESTFGTAVNWFNDDALCKRSHAGSEHSLQSEFHSSFNSLCRCEGYEVRLSAELPLNLCYAYLL